MLLFLVGQIGIWFQTNGQFISPWAKKNPWLLSVIGGTMISYSGNRIVLRTNIGNESGGNAYSPSSGYDYITKE